MLSFIARTTVHEKWQTNSQPSQKYAYNLQNLNKLNPRYYDSIALYQIADAQLLSEIQNTPFNILNPSLLNML